MTKSVNIRMTRQDLLFRWINNRANGRIRTRLPRLLTELCWFVIKFYGCGLQAPP